MPRKKGSANIFKECHCSNCNKLIVIIDKEHYVYKLHIKGKLHYYCSYNCWRAMGGY